MIDPSRFSRDAFVAFSSGERLICLKELETAIHQMLPRDGTLQEFQLALTSVIEDVSVGQLGHWLGRWEYDCEIEYWGGKSYIDQSIPDELLLRSEYPHGVRLSWGDFVFEPWN